LVPLEASLVTKSNGILAEALEERSLRLTFETASSAGDLHGLSPSFIKSLEDMVFDIFENDEPEEMRILSVRDINTGKPVGFICWQDLSSKEIGEWLKACSQKKPEPKLLRDSGRKCSEPSHMLAHRTAPSAELLDQNGWIKIELMAVDSSRQGEKIGAILLAAALAFAASNHQSHAVLQVAGGSQNVPAANLYKKFHFNFAQEHFNVPNDHLMVLWDIREALRSLNWDEFLLTHITDQINQLSLQSK